MPIANDVKFVVTAGLGGCMPTLCGLATTFVTQPTNPIEYGILWGLGVFFVIGAVTAFVLADKNVKSMFLTGIAAPAIIAGINSGKIEMKPYVPAPTYQSSTESSPVTQGQRKLPQLLKSPDAGQ
jgi:xanthine/uracil/vitamin C permease (AzgA family)